MLQTWCRVRQEIRNRLSVRESAWHLPADTLIDRLIAESLEAGRARGVAALRLGRRRQKALRNAATSLPMVRRLRLINST